MNAVNTIKAATKFKDPDLYNEIVYLDLFAKEFLSTIQNAMIVLHMGTVVQCEIEKKSQQMTIVCNLIPNPTERL